MRSKEDEATPADSRIRIKKEILLKTDDEKIQEVVRDLSNNPITAAFLGWWVLQRELPWDRRCQKLLL